MYIYIYIYIYTCIVYNNTCLSRRALEPALRRRRRGPRHARGRREGLSLSLSLFSLSLSLSLSLYPSLSLYFIIFSYFGFLFNSHRNS